ncbi:hypothetical protein IE81DRAFT_363957 [Ceraceosorus guamensis]|uniref:U3 small nucleolar RNA-associated protein 10 n=1 Tax=Ceraceosorus guamensis TaxID=1522189 RepID=A0A316W706_9BASI|nr:hypothetical protein IE81DRAFT_363957 [Ceraceosorus guamensis]PWN45726.1 hypothetical protein IE81DRAFT_363957 [Ceraceosorus guamensis]
MTSTLAAQLAGIRSVNAGRLKSSAALTNQVSYLFPTSTAATQDLDTVHAIGQNGWAELVASNGRYNEWEGAEQLFGEQSKRFDRAVRTSDENQETDELIEQWLKLVAPELLSKPVSKCLEWLVRRFRIYEFNTLALVGVFLPYHQTSQFARMLQIVKLEDHAPLAFLKPLQKRGTPLPSSVLVAAFLGPAHTTPSLDTLRFITSLLPPNSGHAHRALVSFWTATLSQLCLRWAGTLSSGEMRASNASRRAGQKRPEAQDLLPILLPAATAVASSSKTEEARLGGMMVICALGSSFPLSEAAIRATLDALLVETPAHLRDTPTLQRGLVAVLLTLLSSAERPASESTAQLVSEQAVSTFLTMTHTVAELRAAGARYALRPFLQHFLPAVRSTLGKVPAATDALSTLLASASTPDDLRKEILESLLSTGGSTDPACDRARIVVLAHVRQEQASEFDLAVRGLLGKNVDAASRAKVEASLRAVLRAGAGADVKDEDANGPSWLGVNDAEASVRLVALRALIQAVKAGAVDAQDAFVKDAVRARLHDSSAEVLELLLSSGVVLKSISPSECLQIVRVQLQASKLERGCVKHLVAFLVDEIEQVGPECSRSILQSVIWPRLLLSKSHQKANEELIEGLKTIRASTAPAARSLDNDLLVKMSKLSAAEDTAATNQKRIAVIAGSMESYEPTSEHYKELVRWMIKSLNVSADATHHERSAALLSAAVLKALLSSPALVKDAHMFASIAQRALDAVDISVHTDSGSNTPSDAGLLPSTSEAIFSRHGSAHTRAAVFRELALSIVQRLPVEEKAVPATDFCLGNDSPVLKLATTAYTVANSKAAPALGREMLAALFVRLKDSTLSFLASVWCSTITRPNTDVPLSTRSLALRHAHAFLQAFQAAPGGQAGRQVDFQVILPALLLALNDVDTSIRHAALSCIETVGKVASTAADSGNAEIFAFDRLYGRNNSSGLKYLQTKDAAQLCSDLAMSAQSFRHDAQYLPAWLSERLAIKREDSKHDSGYKRSVLSFLLSHVACWPSNGARTALLDALRGVPDASKLLIAVPLLRSLMQSLTPKAAYGSFIERYAQLLLSTFDGSSKSSIDRNVEGSWSVFKEAITSSVTFLQKQACSALEERLARHLSLAHSKEMFELLSSVATSPSHESIAQVSRVLRALKVETAWLVPVISDLRSSLAYTTLNAPASKRARTEDATSVEGGEATLPRRAATLTFILESIADRKLGAQPDLIAELFEVLRVSTEMHTSQAFNADHTLQACLTCLHNTLGAVPSDQASTELVQSLRPDIVVNVVKASSNPQTFNQALLLLTKVVALAPEAVIHNAMPIFTFVGVSVLQRDDALSFSVVERVLRSILPPLVKSLRPAGTADKTDAHLQLLQHARPFICIFTDAATHVPRHRRDVLFQLLVEVLGADEFLSAVTMLLVDQVAHKVVKQSPSDASATLALPIAVFEACSPTVQLHAVVQVLDEASRLWKHRDEPLTDAQAHTFLDPFSRLDEEHTGKHPEAIRRIRALTSLVRQALTLRSLTTSVANVEGSETRSKASKSIANSTLLVIRRALELASIRDTDIGSSAREIASSLVRIAPPSMFIDFVISFIADRDPAANRSGLELVSTRLPRLKQDARDLIADRTPKIITFIAETLPRSTSDAATLQTALRALESLAGTCVPSEHAALSSCLPALVDLGRADQSLRDAMLRVTLPLSRKLGPRLIPHLSALAPFCLLCARQSLEAGHLNSRDAFDTLSGLVSAVPTFMPSYLNDVIEIAGNRALQAAKLESSPLRQAFNKLVNVYVKQIPAQQVLEMISSRWEKAPRSSTHEHLAVLYFTDRLVRMSSKEDLLSVYKPVYRFLVRVFDLRREHAKELSAADLGKVEDHCVDAFVHLVLKLNETTFRPLFLRTYDWAAQDLLEDDDGEEKPLNDLDLVARRLVLYKLINGLLDALKGLFASYYSSVLDLSIGILDGFAQGTLRQDDGSSQGLLWHSVLGSLKRSAQHDTGSFWSPTRLSRTAPAVIAQLTGAAKHPATVSLPTVGGRDRPSISSQTRHVCDVIGALAQAVPDEKSLKHLNNLLLTLSRTRDHRVKVAALTALAEIWSTEELASTLLGLTPESVPHISELLDADDQATLEATNHLVGLIEGILGESLDTYLQ